MSNRDNFSFKIGRFNVVMKDGELEIDGSSYQKDDSEDPTYVMCRRIAFDNGQIDDLTGDEVLVDTRDAPEDDGYGEDEGYRS